MRSRTPGPTISLQDVPHRYPSVPLLSVDASRNLQSPLRPPHPSPVPVGPSNVAYIDPDDVPPALPPKPDLYQELMQENSILKSRMEALLAQFKSQDEIETKNDGLMQEHTALLVKMQDMEQLTSQLLNERNLAATDFTRQNRRVSRHIAETEQAQAQVARLKKHLGVSTQENHQLTLRIREMQDAADALSLRTMSEIEDFRKQIENLEQDNEHLRNRALEMEQSISQSQTSNSETDIRELRILMGDVTRENEDLKKRLRNMETSTTHFLLSSNDRALMDDLKRDNQDLKLQIMEMEEFTRQLQSSSEDSELRRMLEDVTHENEDLKERLHEMEVAITQSQSSTRVEDLRMEIDRLKAEIRGLRVQIETSSSLETEEDNTIPPPAYDDT